MRWKGEERGGDMRGEGIRGGRGERGRGGEGMYCIRGRSRGEEGEKEEEI